MKKRTCPFSGHSTRERIIHKDGKLYRGIANINETSFPITVRYGPSRSGSDLLFGMAITFKDRSDTPQDKPMSDSNEDDGDILTIGRNNGIASTYHNDATSISDRSLSDNVVFAIVNSAFSRTGMDPNFTGLPHNILNVDPSTKAFIRYTGINGKGYVNDETKTIPFDEVTHWELCDESNGDIIMKFIMCPSRDKEGRQLEGNDLLFKHNLREDPSPPPCINNCCGVTCNILKILCTSCTSCTSCK